jgi:hypothetical protein
MMMLVVDIREIHGAQDGDTSGATRLSTAETVGATGS